jgi:hypothetical protein
MLFPAVAKQAFLSATCLKLDDGAAQLITAEKGEALLILPFSSIKNLISNN